MSHLEELSHSAAITNITSRVGGNVMATPWLSAATVDDGEKKKEPEELLVFGYACKLFPYDEKAALIEGEKHLIPWMGDENVMIDRYDGRGHLYDLSDYDAEKKNHDSLSEEEKHIEAMCDQERYLELHTDVQEQALYEEEEWKRYYQSLSEGFNAVGFSYEQQYDPSLPTDEDLELNACLEAAVEKFVAAKELQVPPEMDIPDSNKINAIVEKTANFVVMQGGQMEIMIKTKQSNNPLFEFLNIDNKLYPYYKHMIKMIKTGKYKPKVENESDDDDYLDENQSYLHPILTVKSQPAECRKPVKLPVVDIQNTTYGDLIRSVKASTARQNAKRLKAKELEASESKPSIPPFMAQPVYGPNVPPPPGVEPVTLPPSDQPPPPGTDNAVPLCLPKYDSSDSPDNTTGSDQQNDIIPPAPDVQPVIDKMALYVAKNGVEFEMVVKNKCDPRFEFLNKDHVHYPYYEFKKQLHIKEFDKERKKIEEQKAAQNKGVSFSIKAKTKEQESVPLEKRPVFACESSEDECEADVQKQQKSQSNSPDAESGEFQSNKKSTEIKLVSEDKMEKTDSSQEDMDRKLAEEKLKDRLALAAREKLAQATKEKQLQAERKRKAALFINMLKSSNQIVPNVNENADGDHLEMGYMTLTGSSGNTPIPSQSSSPQHDTNYQNVNSLDHTLDSGSKREIGHSPSERGNEKTDHHQQTGSHSRSHQRHSRSPTPPSAYNMPRSRYHNSTVVLHHQSEKSRSQSLEKRSRSPYNKKLSKSPSRKRSSSKSPSRKGKSTMTKSPSPSKRKHQHSQSRSRSRSPSRYISGGRQNKRRDWSRSPNYAASSHNRSSKLRRHSRSRSPSHPSRSQYSSLGTQSHRREKSRSRSQSRSHRDRSKSPHSKKNKSPSRKRSHSKSPIRKFKSYSKSPNSKKKHKRSRSRSSSKKQSKSSRSESDKNLTKSSCKAKSRKDGKDKKSHLSSKSIKKDSSKKKNGDVTDKRKELSKNGGPTIDLTTKSDSLIELSSETENDVNCLAAAAAAPPPPPPNDHKSIEVTVPPKPESQVSEAILSKVRAMLKASRQAILKEDKDISDV